MRLNIHVEQDHSSGMLALVIDTASKTLSFPIKIGDNVPIEMEVREPFVTPYPDTPRSDECHCPLGLTHRLECIYWRPW